MGEDKRGGAGREGAERSRERRKTWQKTYLGRRTWQENLDREGGKCVRHTAYSITAAAWRGEPAHTCVCVPCPRGGKERRGGERGPRSYLKVLTKAGLVYSTSVYLRRTSTLQPSHDYVEISCITGIELLAFRHS